MSGVLIYHSLPYYLEILSHQTWNWANGLQTLESLLISAAHSAGFANMSDGSLHRY